MVMMKEKATKGEIITSYFSRISQKDLIVIKACSSQFYKKAILIKTKTAFH